MNVKLLIDKIAVLELQCKEFLASNNPLLISINNALNLLAVHYAEERENFINDTFESSKQHIDYFKLYHSKLISLCLFYKSIQRIERKLLYRSEKKQLKILRKEVEALDSISKDNQNFIGYITEKNNHFDEQYFIPDHKTPSLDSFSFVKRDPLFSTHHSILLGEILSGHRTLEYINQKLDSLKNIRKPGTSSLLTLKWKRKKVDFVEVVRALEAEGAFEEDITTIFNALSQVIDTGPINHFGVYKDIKNRTNGKTKYLNKAAQALQDMMDQDYN